MALLLRQELTGSGWFKRDQFLSSLYIQKPLIL
jgi:hypothetical protein